jgi:hypothetical protein
MLGRSRKDGIELRGFKAPSDQSCDHLLKIREPCSSAVDHPLPRDRKSLLEEVGAYSFAAAHPQAELTNAQAQVDNTPLEIDGVCCYNFKASEQPCAGCIPEAPWTPALLAAGVALVGVGVYRSRRNSRSASSLSE